MRRVLHKGPGSFPARRLTPDALTVLEPFSDGQGQRLMQRLTYPGLADNCAKPAELGGVTLFRHAQCAFILTP